ncbi:recombinase family protein [Mesorhizobium tamadayense]|uniref:Recombinase family protein n=1 Tax=Mesorhizobium tamadayense TaxID=425306 RepID=A0A3P3ELZ7_9HYPH|nr:recombinase family protein [Mesorhizobium tamadayense]RRH87106.1 recombinase family protein [Mesorhizobium tamadayense]
MNEKLKVQSHHLERSAYLYIRQSSMRQVMENVESTKRQYDLRGRAIGLGWRDDQVTVIDSDQGESGASASWREGFQHLVSDVGMGRAGIVMGLEVSRLARNNADWHRLLEICALADTLILDEDGVYDPANFNDRLLLGLKGTMSEAELHVIKARLRGGILNKARRGEYRCPLPTGFIYNEVGDVVFDPDAQIREMITHFFETFSRVGSATQTVKAFAREGLLFPSRFRNSKRVVFQPLTTSAALRTLHNPRYAGVYAYGQRLYRRTVDGKKQFRKREPNEWLACIPDAHPGYISWEQFQHNLKALEANGQGYQTARVSPPREGAALLQGRVICGRCGCHMRARYVTRRGQVDTWYVCSRAYVSRGEPHCQSIAGWPVDAAIGELIAAEMTPAAVELALEIRKEIEARYDEADKLRLRAVERAQIDADLAQRRFMLVDPNNRLVADTLEREWNDKLRMLSDLREERVSALRQDRATLDDVIRDRLIAMTADFKTVWRDPTLPNRERKRLLAYLVEDVTLLKFQAEGETRMHIRFRGGKTETLITQNPKTSAQQVKTRPEVVELVDKLLDDHICAEIADILNARGIRPGGSARRGKADAQFSDLRVIYLVKQYGLRSRYDRLRERGMLTKAEACAKLGITECTLVRWAKYGIVKRHAYNGYIGLYELPGPHVPAKQCSRWNQLAHRAEAIRRLNSSKCSDLKERAVV